MDRRRLLTLVSGAQLAAGLAGMAVAVRRRHPYDLPLLHGRVETVGRDSVLMGTAMSAPVVMLIAQAAAIGVLLRRPSAPAERVLGALGAAMVPGHLGESLFRRRIRAAGWDALESPLSVISVALALAMPLLSRFDRS